MTTLFTIDFETTLRCRTMGAQPSPDWDIRENFVVWSGWCVDPTRVHVEKRDSRLALFRGLNHAPSDTFVVGHNVKFDLHYLAKTGGAEVQHFFRAGGRLWDTMLAEYLLDGAAHVGQGGYSLDAVCTRRGLPTKPNALSEKYWSKGVSTEDIPDEEVEPYLRHDVEVTHRLAQRQITEATDRGILPWMLAMMDSVLGTFLIEHRGVYFDVPEALERNDRALRRCEELRKLLAEAATRRVAKWDSFNPLSPKDLSCLFFGGKLTFQVDRPVLTDEGHPVRFKSGVRKGQVKTRKESDEVVLAAAVSPSRVGATKTKQGFWSCGSDVLEKVRDMSGTRASAWAEWLLELRDLEKDSKTYYVGYSNQVGHDGTIHTNYRHTVTPTGRLSSSNPNVQNMKGHLKDLFKPQLEVFVEADYEQLEIRVLCELSRDPTLREDLDSGVDLHRVRAAEWLGKEEHLVTEAERRAAKGISFGLQYGQSVNSIAKDNGIPLSSAQRFVDSYYARYPAVGKWQDHIAETVRLTRKPWKVEGSTPLGRGSIKMDYGRTFVFSERTSKFRREASFYPPDLKNWPVQGVATGDVVLLCLGRLARRQLHDRGRWYLANTVHDSFLVDTTKENLTYAQDVLQYYMEDMPRWMREVLGFEWETPLPTDTKSGTTWGNLTKE